MEFRPVWALVVAVLLPAQALAWGSEGHSIVAEVAQHRLTPQAAAEVDRLLGPGRSLASVASWADDVRDDRPESYRWHFVDLALAEDRYDPTKHCHTSAKGDCIVAELERLKTDLRCAATDDLKRDALRYAVHFVGDIHQPLHTVGEGRGGNDVAVEVKLAGAKTCRGGPCPIMSYRSNFHRVWDGTLIKATTWSWGAYVDRLETGWLASPEAKGVDGGTPAEWAEETHLAGRTVWEQLPANRVVDDAYYGKILPTLDRQLGLAGLRLAHFLNDVQAPGQCVAR
jgi:hypothetical protein